MAAPTNQESINAEMIASLTSAIGNLTTALDTNTKSRNAAQSGVGNLIEMLSITCRSILLEKMDDAADLSDREMESEHPSDTEDQNEEDDQAGGSQAADGDEQAGDGDEQAGDGDEQAADVDELAGDGDEASAHQLRLPVRRKKKRKKPTAAP